VSDVPKSSISESSLLLLPHEIHIDQRYNVRPFSGNSVREEERIRELSASMDSLGQLDNLLLTPDQVLIAGHRRRKAALMLNESRTAMGRPLMRLRCSVDSSNGDLRRKAISSNLHRRDQSPMDLAFLMVQIRQEYSWQGPDGTRQLCKYLGICRMAVSQYERLLSCEKQLQDRIHEGIVSLQSALDLLKTLPSPAERAKALERAVAIQEENLTERAMAAYQRNPRNRAIVTRTLTAPRARRIEHPAIVAAIREQRTGKCGCLSRAELVGSIAQFDQGDYPEPVRQWARYFTSVYAQGLGTSQELRKKFEQALSVTEKTLNARAFAS
jgi:ParB/Sulfiredoxin domain